MTRLGWAIVKVERIERITTLHHGCSTKEEAMEWAREHIRTHPGEPFDDLFLVEDLTKPEENRINVAQAWCEEVLEI